MVTKTGDFSVVGKHFVADFGEKAFDLFYENESTLILTAVRGPEAGTKQLLKVKMTELRPNLFMVTWQEANKLANVDIEDYENGTVYANMTTPSLNFVSAKGSLKRLG